MSTHKCARPGCKKQIGMDRFACRVDWFLLTEDLRRTINASFRKLRLNAEGAYEAWTAAARKAMGHWGTLKEGPNEPKVHILRKDRIE